MKRTKKLIAAFLAILMLLSSVPFAVTAAPAADIPKEMLDNVYLSALAYTGYNVQKQKNEPMSIITTL